MSATGVASNGLPSSAINAQGVVVFSLLRLFKRDPYKFKVNDVVIFVDIFGVVSRWTISERTTYELHTGEIVRAYLHKDTQTPWFPTLETELRKATKADLTASDAELQARYGFRPTEWYGCY